MIGIAIAVILVVLHSGASFAAGYSFGRAASALERRRLKEELELHEDCSAQNMHERDEYYALAVSLARGLIACSPERNCLVGRAEELVAEADLEIPF